MRTTKPILKETYIPTWKQGPGYLVQRFAEIRKQQREQAKTDECLEYKLNAISKVRAMTRSGR